MKLAHGAEGTYRVSFFFIEIAPQSSMLFPEQFLFCRNVQTQIATPKS